VFTPADARAAFEKGRGAWAIWDPFLAAAEKQTGARILADGRGVVNNYAYYLAERSYVEKRPEVIQALFDDVVAQGKWLKANLKQAAAIIAPLQGLDADVVELNLRRYGYGVTHLTDAVIAEQQKIADTFYDLKLIRSHRRARSDTNRRAGTRIRAHHEPSISSCAAPAADPGPDSHQLGQPTAAQAQAALAKAPEQLRIGYQKSAVNLVILKQQSVLEKRFPNTRVSWIEFPAGPQLLEALSVGSLEFGLTGDSPPVFAQAPADLLCVGAEPPKPDSSAILVLKDSPVKKLADLKGRKIALQKGSSAHYLLVRAVEKAGLQWSDIQPVYLAPADARAAFERKSVDAWAIWDPYYAATELAIQPRVLATGRDLSSNNSFYLASRPLPPSMRKWPCCSRS
jgi:ABC-type nitrate/sulfonate/bicarbonate transport system substrate-binding protein